MKNSLFGIIFLEPDRLTLRIIELPTLKIITEVQSGALIVGSHNVANYAQNMQAIVDNLQGFQRILHEYQVEKFTFYGSLEDLNLVEARYIADQLKVRTNLDIKWLSNDQLMASALAAVMARMPRFNELSKKALYVLTIGLNTTRLSYFRHGKFQTSWDIDLGEARVNHLAQTLRQTTTTPSEIILDYISSKLEYLVPELRHVKNSNLLIHNVGTMAQSYVKPGEMLGKVPREGFEKRYQRIVSSSNQFIINHYNVDEQSVNWVLPNYLVISRTIHLLDAQKIYATSLHILDGLTIMQLGDHLLVDNMIRTSAANMAQRYGADTAHSTFVTHVALQLFDALQPIHRLDRHDRLLLEIACKIEDIGNFINPQGHYRHSQYILEANPLIGLSADDNRTIAEVARYHSSESPDVAQAHYRYMDDDIQMPVAKLAAILRVADSLDDSRLQKISRIELKLQDDRLLITAHANDDLVLEKWAFQRKNQLFTDVYGLKPELIAKEGE
ncbi:exopolyphosphatase [Limosilactobacillus mucosae]|uniref:exopolyphosphatase n=1 Tax=Limosilactobacillus mucosae TaxID=97478 RepID=UPI00233EE1B3|nr:exopolyphosphatase [Limosilactobacillus mucosae]MDC2839076.1 exopolyphosphatase [Limosilactobacillus mucosae]MDC2845413.1 exopolyphosphatase [Limosilactobacillus mucosae]